MIYVLLPRGGIEWDDIRIFTTFAQVERLITSATYAIAFEGTDELVPCWIYQLEKGLVHRWAISPSPSES